jgi:uracil phosphoribosyltransferase
MFDSLQTKTVVPSADNYPISLFQSPQSRALNVGWLTKKGKSLAFIPGRLTFGAVREQITYAATIQSFNLPNIKKLFSKYNPKEISTITVLRETLACRLGNALFESGIKGHFGDAFIGAVHVKGDGAITTDDLYENTEGLIPNGLWIVADSICMGRNLAATLKSLLKKFTPKEILFVATIASRRGINNLSRIVAEQKIPATFVAWGALYGVDEKTLYNMPWGHRDTEPVDRRDQNLIVSMYGPELCVGGDFGNNYYSPPFALKLYQEQLKEHKITSRIPLASEVLKIYKQNEVLML